MKVAIVHDWLVGGGAERVVEELHKLYPDAPIYTSYCTPEWRKRLDNKVVTGFLQRWPFGLLRKFVGPLRLWWFGHLDLSGYDLVISSSGNGEAKSVKVPKGTPHICYCHSPVRFYWRDYQRYIKQPGFGPFNFLARFGLRLLVKPLRNRDYQAAQRVDYFIANSSFIAEQITKSYGRESTVIHPPLDTKRFKQLSPARRNGFVTMGRQVQVKRTELIVDACTKLNLPLTVIGKGPEHDDLVRRAGPRVTFPDTVADSEMAEYLSRAEGFIFAAEEDFGIAPLEGLASGTPLVAYKGGGALDYVIPGKTGIFFEEQTVDSLVSALEDFDPSIFKPDDLRKYAEKYSETAFADNMKSFIRKVANG